MDDPRLTQICGWIYPVVSSISDRAVAMVKMKAFDSPRQRERERERERETKSENCPLDDLARHTLCHLFFHLSFRHVSIQNVSLLSRHEIGQRSCKMRYNSRQEFQEHCLGMILIVEESKRKKKYARRVSKICCNS